ncbi:hypothetical protein AB0L75_40080 [Streptomyces sp. NPDC052101]|uniref:hypothetical protein n=1 Tax=Streptomyces sp. NPDC052101 TaxID=3155763 RepID=UPI0034182C13
MLLEPRLRDAQALLLAGHPRRAADRCTRALGRPVPTGTPGLKAAFGALRAEALLCLGDLAAAQRQAETAARTAPPGSALTLWPTAVLAQALTEQGRYEEAARQLRHAAPGPLPDTAYALPYLRARGRYLLATGPAEEALTDFLRAGQLATRRDAAVFSHLPWRTDAAEALLRLGRPEQAADLITEQSGAAGDLGARHRGIALRVRAATEEPVRRPGTLARATVELRAAGDRLELARAYAGLGDALSELGEDSMADAMLGRARHLAADCGAAPLLWHTLPTAPPVLPVP